jgi:ABC-2 type transport system ATP-binding protein
MKRKVLLTTLFTLAALVPLRAGADVTVEQGFIQSFDGTEIRYTLFLPDGAGEGSPVPAVLRTHGWGGTGQKSTGGFVSTLLDNGYAVLTWDQRGFGESGGQVEIDHPDWEGKDVSALIDFLVSRPEILKETEADETRRRGMPETVRERLPDKARRFEVVTDDPVIGMSGGSYAGGIQLMTAAFDNRIDAIAPEIAWHTLPRSIFPNGVPKFGWDTLLYGVGQTALTGGLSRGETGNYNPMIHESYSVVSATNDPSPYQAWYDERSPRHYNDAITAPTLVIQGTIDTLFSITEGVNNFLQISDNETADGTLVPTKLLLYNSGHTLGSSVPAADAGARAGVAIVSWFDRYLKGENVDTGPLVEYQDNLGEWHSAEAWPVGSALTVAGTAGPLVVTPAPSGGGNIANGNPNSDFQQASARIPVLTADDDGTTIVGVPQLKGTVSGIGEGAFLFFKLVDPATNEVLSDQVTALSVKLLDGPAAFDIQLEGVSWKLEPGDEVVLEVSTGSMMYTNYRGAATVELDLELTLPVL